MGRLCRCKGKGGVCREAATAVLRAGTASTRPLRRAPLPPQQQQLLQAALASGGYSPARTRHVKSRIEKVFMRCCSSSGVKPKCRVACERRAGGGRAEGRMRTRMGSKGGRGSSSTSACQQGVGPPLARSATHLEQHVVDDCAAQCSDGHEKAHPAAQRVQAARRALADRGYDDHARSAQHEGGAGPEGAGQAVAQQHRLRERDAQRRPLRGQHDWQGEGEGEGGAAWGSSGVRS